MAKTYAAIIYSIDEDKFLPFTKIERCLDWMQDTFDIVRNDPMADYDVEFTFVSYDEEGIARFNMERI